MELIKQSRGSERALGHARGEVKSFELGRLSPRCLPGNHSKSSNVGSRIGQDGRS